MTFDELLAKYEPAHAAAFRQALEEIKSGIVLRVVVERLERGSTALLRQCTWSQRHSRLLRWH
jgi:hypothetical protein